MSPRQLERWAPVIAGAGMLLLWQAVCSAFRIPDYIFPSPWTIAEAMAEQWG